MEKTVAEFFAGIGLMRMGLERAGWDIAWANGMPLSSMRRGLFRKAGQGSLWWAFKENEKALHCLNRHS